MASFLDSMLESLVSGLETYRRTRRVDPPVVQVARASSGRGLSKRVSGENPNADRYARVLGGQISVEAISSALRRAEIGFMRAQCELLSEMRETTTHLQAELAKREDAVSSCEWALSPAKTEGMGKRDLKLAAKICDDIKARVDAVEDFSDTLKHLAGGIYFGRSASEIIYLRDRDGIGIQSLVPVLPKRLSYAKNWKIHLFDEAGNDSEPTLGVYPGIDIRDEWPNKFIIHEPRTLGPELPTRQGLGRVLVWAAMFWKWNARHWLIFAELFANPWRIAGYPRNWNDEDIDELKQSMLELSGLTTAVYPEGCKPEFLQVSDTETHVDLNSAWLAEISKVVNGATLTTQVASTSGSRALGEVHERESNKFTRGDGRALNASIRRDMIRPLVRLNYGEEAAQTLCPMFKLATDPPEDREKLANRIFGLVDRGGEVDMDEARDKLTGLSKPDPKAKLLKPLGGGGGAPDGAPPGGNGTPPGEKPAAADEAGAGTKPQAADEAPNEGAKPAKKPGKKSAENQLVLGGAAE